MLQITPELLPCPQNTLTCCDAPSKTSPRPCLCLQTAPRAAALEAEPLAKQLSSGEANGYPRSRVRSFVGLDSDDVRHPLDAQNTRLLRRLPGLDWAAKSLMGSPYPSPSPIKGFCCLAMALAVDRNAR